MRRKEEEYPRPSGPPYTPPPIHALIQTKCVYLWKEYPFKTSELAVSCRVEYWSQGYMLDLE